MTQRLGWRVFILGCGLFAGCGGEAPINGLDQGAEQGTSEQGPVDGHVPADADVDDVGADQSPPDDQGPGIVLEVGFGATGSFTVASGMGVAAAVMGVQGGYHLDMGLRVRGLSQADLNAGAWTIQYAFRSAGGITLSDPIARSLTAATVSFDGTGQVRSGDRVFFTSSNPSVHNLTTITLEVRLTNGSMSVVDTGQVTLLVP